MDCSRRDLAFLVSALAAGQATAQTSTLKAQTFRIEDVPPSGSGPLRSSQFLKGTTHSGFLIDMHGSELAAGEAPHESHSHEHEEMLLMREGTLEVTIAGRKTNVGPGSGAFIASNTLHGWRNVGSGPARYFVLALGEDK